mgnify:CR=1 FL=1
MNLDLSNIDSPNIDSSNIDLPNIDSSNIDSPNLYSDTDGSGTQTVSCLHTTGGTGASASCR